jgi:hypothetical protein
MLMTLPKARSRVHAQDTSGVSPTPQIRTLLSHPDQRRGAAWRRQAGEDVRRPLHDRTRIARVHASRRLPTGGTCSPGLLYGRR